jgi:hypothetical protein
MSNAHFLFLDHRHRHHQHECVEELANQHINFPSLLWKKIDKIHKVFSRRLSRNWFVAFCEPETICQTTLFETTLIPKTGDEASE